MMWQSVESTGVFLTFVSMFFLHLYQSLLQSVEPESHESELLQLHDESLSHELSELELHQLSEEVLDPLLEFELYE